MQRLALEYFRYNTRRHSKFRRRRNPGSSAPEGDFGESYTYEHQRLFDLRPSTHTYYGCPVCLFNKGTICFRKFFSKTRVLFSVWFIMFYFFPYTYYHSVLCTIKDSGSWIQYHRGRKG